MSCPKLFYVNKSPRSYSQPLSKEERFSINQHVQGERRRVRKATLPRKCDRLPLQCRNAPLPLATARSSQLDVNEIEPKVSLSSRLEKLGDYTEVAEEHLIRTQELVVQYGWTGTRMSTSVGHSVDAFNIACITIDANIYQLLNTTCTSAIQLFRTRSLQICYWRRTISSMTPALSSEAV